MFCKIFIKFRIRKLFYIFKKINDNPSKLSLSSTFVCVHLPSHKLVYKDIISISTYYRSKKLISMVSFDIIDLCVLFRAFST